MNMNILATTVEYMMVFGLPTSNTECTQIPYGKSSLDFKSGRETK